MTDEAPIGCNAQDSDSDSEGLQAAKAGGGEGGGGYVAEGGWGGWASNTQGLGRLLRAVSDQPQLVHNISRDSCVAADLSAETERVLVILEEETDTHRVQLLEPHERQRVKGVKGRPALLSLLVIRRAW